MQFLLGCVGSIKYVQINKKTEMNDSEIVLYQATYLLYKIFLSMNNLYKQLYYKNLLINTPLLK